MLEQPEPSRSDCHAWGLTRSSMPTRPSWGRVLLSLVSRASASRSATRTVSPDARTFPDARDGYVSFDLVFEEGIRGSIVLPDSLEGELLWRGMTLPLIPGPIPSVSTGDWSLVSEIHARRSDGCPLNWLYDMA